MTAPRHPDGIFRINADGRREKRCGGCNVWQPHDAEHFHRHRAKPDGLQSHCKACQCKASTAAQAARNLARAQIRQAWQEANNPRKRRRNEPHGAAQAWRAVAHAPSPKSPHKPE